MCLDTAGGKLLFTPEKARQIILASCVLHNIAVKEGVPFLDPAPAENIPEDPPHGPQHPNVSHCQPYRVQAETEAAHFLQHTHRMRSEFKTEKEHADMLLGVSSPST